MDILIINELNVNFDTQFSKEYCYSFVIQHPKNKFVIPVIEKRLYLIAIYKINNEIINSIIIINGLNINNNIERVLFIFLSDRCRPYTAPLPYHRSRAQNRSLPTRLRGYLNLIAIFVVLSKKYTAFVKRTSTI